MINTMEQPFEHVHRNLNPENFLVGEGRKLNMKVRKKRCKGITIEFKSMIMDNLAEGAMTASKAEAA